MSTTTVRTPLQQKTNNSNVFKTSSVKSGTKRKTDQIIDLCTSTEHASKKIKGEGLNSPDPFTKLASRTRKQATDKGDRLDKVEEWRIKFKKVFKTFRFYFDLGTNNDALVIDLTRQVQHLGASVEDFFSRNVTHVVTIHDAESREQHPSTAVKPRPGQPSKRPSTKLTPPRFASSLHKNISPGEKNPFFSEKQEIVSKAQAMGIKVWNLEKTHRVLGELLNSNSPFKATTHRQLSLPHLLRVEALSGVTTERDPATLRPDYTYFAPRTYYLLVEDSQGKHRTLISKEFPKPRRNEEPEYPVLQGGVEGRSAFSSRDQSIPPLPPGVTPIPLPSKQTHALLQPVQVQPLLPPARAGSNVYSLRKSVSVNQFTKKLSGESGIHHNQEKQGFLAASGNSQTITSNIASMTSAANNSAPHLGYIDSRLAALDKRQVSMNAGSLFPSKVGLGAQPVLSAAAQDIFKSQRAKPKRTSSKENGLMNKNPARPVHPKKPGYCENCRLRYEDFQEHVVSRRHRKFALTAINWVQLDNFLSCVEREPSFAFPEPFAISTSTWSDPESREADEDMALPAWNVYDTDEQDEDTKISDTESCTDPEATDRYVTNGEDLCEEAFQELCEEVFQIADGTDSGSE